MHAYHLVRNENSHIFSNYNKEMFLVTSHIIHIEKTTDRKLYPINTPLSCSGWRFSINFGPNITINKYKTTAPITYLGDCTNGYVADLASPVTKRSL